jgi:hypothetical protein
MPMKYIIAEMKLVHLQVSTQKAEMPVSPFSSLNLKRKRVRSKLPSVNGNPITMKTSILIVEGFS